MASETEPVREVPKAGVLIALMGLLSFGRERTQILRAQEWLYQQCGGVFMQSVLGFRFVNLFGPDANRLVLLDRERFLSARRPWTMIMGRIFPNGLLLRDGEDHKVHRNIMHEAFKQPVLRDYVARMNPMIDAGLAQWSPGGRPLLAFGAFKDLTLDMAASLFLGEELGLGTRRTNQAFERMVAASMSRLRVPVPGFEFYGGLKGREFMIEYLRERIAARRASQAPDIFSRLCRVETDDGERFSDDEIIDHLIFLMMAAHDTTTSTLSSLTYQLARHEDWQERIREESLALGKQHADFDDLDGLESLTWAMRETLRLYPPLPVIPRVAIEDFEFAGYRIAADTMVVISPILTHHMGEWWTRPYHFDPERFSPARAEHERHTHVWVPFGGGPHMCLGMRFAEMQVRAIMHQMVRRYRWSVAPGYTMPVQRAPISKPQDGLPIQLDRIA